MARIGFLGPPGTFTEEALLTQPDLAESELVPYGSMPDVLAATDAGEVELGFVAIENSIEGTVNVSLDALTFEHDLLIQRDVVLNVSMSLIAPTGPELKDVKRGVPVPHAAAQ